MAVIPDIPEQIIRGNYVPCLIYGKEIKAGVNLHTRKGFADMAATIAEALGSTYRGDGESFWGEIRNKR